ncbi:MAG: LacI family DNA-binding transcriptional regulator [bacterium]|nr:LacI family DNA-binding transcriptional regulator [bacterium]
MSKYQKICDRLREEIVNGAWTGGARFASIKDICDRFCVSYLTASKVLSELRRRQLIRTVPGKGAFVCENPRAIALIVPSLEGSEYYEPICQEICARIRRRGWRLYYSEMAGESVEECVRLVRVAAEDAIGRQVSAVVYLPMFFGADFSTVNREIFDLFRKSSIPLVIFDNDVGEEAEGFDFIGVDNFDVGVRLARHLVSSGANHLLFVAERDVARAPNAFRRFAGIESVVLGSRKRTATRFELTAASQGRLRRLIKTGTYDGLIGLNDATALKLLEQAQAAGRRVPNEVRVAGVNGLELSRLAIPGLTTARQPIKSIAEAVVDTVEWRVANPRKPARRIFVESELVVRGSTVGPKDREGEEKK